MESFMKDRLEAEILWPLKSVKAHFSFNTNVNVGKLFQKRWIKWYALE